MSRIGAARSISNLVVSGLAATVVGAVANVAFLLVLLRNVGPDGAGIVVVAVAVQVLMFRATDLGTTGANVRCVSGRRTVRDSQAGPSELDTLSEVENPLLLSLPVLVGATALAASALHLSAGFWAELFASELQDQLATGLRYVALASPFFTFYMVFAHGLKGFERFGMFRIVERLGRPVAYLCVGLFGPGDRPDQIIGLVQLVNVGLSFVALTSFVWAQGQRSTDPDAHCKELVPIGVSR